MMHRFTWLRRLVFNRWLLFTGLICVAVVSNAASADANFAKANAAYKAGQYDEAITLYRQVRSAGVENAALYYNLGNAYYKNEQTGEAILQYERALKLAPNDEDVLHNLKLANLKTTDRLPAVPQLAIVKGWDRLLHGRSSGSWAWICIGCLWAMMALLSLRLFLSSGRGVILSLVLLLAIGTVATGYASVSQYHDEENSGEAILMTDNAYVKSAPDANGTDLFMIHEGLKMTLLDQVGDWAKVRLADGKVGWVPKSDIERI
ncbi:MAG: tetratricopeptide repeat protein [Chitinophagales bacterium]